MANEDKGYMEAFFAEKAAREAYEQARPRGRSKIVLGQNVAPYAGFRNATFDPTLIFGDPTCFLKPGDWVSKEDFLWRKPDDPYTKSMVNRGVIRPVFTEEVDRDSKHAAPNSVRQVTKAAPRHVVRSPGGLGLFFICNRERLQQGDLEQLPGEYWDGVYKSDLADMPSANEFENELESLSNSSMTGRVRQLEPIAPKD